MLQAIIVFLLTLVLYVLTADLLNLVNLKQVSYFNYLAESFLHGQLYLTNPPYTLDLAKFEGRWYVPFPPLPALLMLPWVAITGAKALNVYYFSMIIGALNVGLVFLFLTAIAKRGWTSLGLRDNLILTALFGFGSAHWYLSLLGGVWYISQICTVLFILAAALITIHNGPAWLTGVALAMAMLARPTVAFTWLFLFAIAYQLYREKNGQKPFDWRYWLRWTVFSVVPMVLVGLALLFYNYVRFHDFLDFGYLKADVTNSLRLLLTQYGQFNLHYVPTNLGVMLFGLPKIDPTNGAFGPDSQGMSLFITMPVIIFLYRARQATPLVIGAWAALLTLLVPLITYYNTGWSQFGYRFSLDFILPFITLLAVTGRKRLPWLFITLVCLGILFNFYGTYWFGINQRP